MHGKFVTFYLTNLTTVNTELFVVGHRN